MILLILYIKTLMSVHKELLDVVKDVETLMEILPALVMRDIKHIMKTQHTVLVCCSYYMSLLCSYIYYKHAIIAVKNIPDIDECVESNGGCQHICKNIVGSYQCLCDSGYALGPNEHSCEGNVIKQSYTHVYQCTYYCTLHRYQ